MAKFAWWDVIAYSCPSCAAKIRRDNPDCIGTEPDLDAMAMEYGCDYCGKECVELFPVADLND